MRAPRAPRAPRRGWRWWLPLLALGLAVPDASAVQLTLRSEEQPFPGITVRRYRTSNPACNAWVALIELCTARIRLDATGPTASLQATGSWASDVGAQLATNGDFYQTGPLRIYGDAVGGGVPWPRFRTGLDPDYDDEWYHDRFGWIAFGHDWVEFSHTKQVRRNVPGLAAGWAPGARQSPGHPPGTLALVSGFPELVIEGEQVRCPAGATDDSCFPDRSDMRARHPRTAMGLTEDRRTFLLLVVDGRTGDSAGMYGVELAATMRQLGAWEAFNLDGGGSSQFWVRGQGYLNDLDGNNSGNGTRSVANHWGVFAGGGGPARPGHCPENPPCAVLPAGGGIVDDGGPCFSRFGPAEYWRTEARGEGGGLHWTNPSEGPLPANWAWWQLHLAEAGRYRVEFVGDPQFGLFDRARYEVLAAGELHEVVADQGAAAGWHLLGEFRFAAGGRQHVAIFDDTPEDPGRGQHILADAIRLTRLDPYCGDGRCDIETGERAATCPADCDEPGPCDPACDAGPSPIDGGGQSIDAGPEPRDGGPGLPDEGPLTEDAGLPRAPDGTPAPTDLGWSAVDVAWFEDTTPAHTDHGLQEDPPDAAPVDAARSQAPHSVIEGGCACATRPPAFRSSPWRLLAWWSRS